MTAPASASLGTIAHRAAILAYIVFALFPLYWLLKVSVTPNDLLYSEGVRMWPSRTSIEHYDCSCWSTATSRSSSATA